jgi:hypothetical protein
LSATYDAKGHGEPMGPGKWLGMFWIWVVHTAIGAGLSAPVVYVGRDRVHWGVVDLLSFVLPFAVWTSLLFAWPAGKSLANLAEPFVFSVAIPAAASVRVVVGRRFEERTVSTVLVALLCLAAGGVYWLMPSLPE